MEKNIKVVTKITYYDIEKEKEIPQNTVRWLTEKRAKELYEKDIIKLLEIRKCIYEQR